MFWLRVSSLDHLSSSSGDWHERQMDFLQLMLTGFRPVGCGSRGRNQVQFQNPGRSWWVHGGIIYMERKLTKEHIFPRRARVLSVV